MTDRRTTRQLPRSERQTDGPPRDAPTAPGSAELRTPRQPEGAGSDSGAGKGGDEGGE